jgi:glucose-1-phosphate cytidylyltransferase
LTGFRPFANIRAAIGSGRFVFVSFVRLRRIMKAVILAGGRGTRLSEETHLKPKPMVHIGNQPILWHIMKTYSHHGIHDFVICLGYKGYVIKEYFANYFLHKSDVTFDLRNNQMTVHQRHAEPWRVTLIDTGEDTMTGGRLRAVQDLLAEDDFCMTYGDGVSDVDIGASLEFHRHHGKLATVTAVRPHGRFGSLKLDGECVEAFKEKAEGEEGWINGGFFVLSPRVLDYIDGPETIWERDPLVRLAAERELVAYRHEGFWQPMDTLREKELLEDCWERNQAPWKVWSDPAERVSLPLTNVKSRKAA